LLIFWLFFCRVEAAGLDDRAGQHSIRIRIRIRINRPWRV